MLKNSLFEKLDELDLLKNDYAIFGSAPLYAHGLIDKIGDIDIVARGEAWKKAKKLGKHKVSKFGDDEVVEIDEGKIEITNEWGPGEWDVDKLIDDAETIEGYRFVDLKTVLKWKKELNRPKDQKHIKKLEAYFNRR